MTSISLMFDNRDKNQLLVYVEEAHNDQLLSDPNKQWTQTEFWLIFDLEFAKEGTKERKC